MSISRDEGVDLFGDPDDAWDPEKQTNRQQHRNAKAEKTKGAGSAVNGALWGNAVNRFQ